MLWTKMWFIYLQVIIFIKCNLLTQTNSHFLSVLQYLPNAFLFSKIVFLYFIFAEKLKMVTRIFQTWIQQILFYEPRRGNMIKIKQNSSSYSKLFVWSCFLLFFLSHFSYLYIPLFLHVHTHTHTHQNIKTFNEI